MRRKTLFIILCITTLTFLGCGKTETPVMSNSVETEVETKEETSTQNEVITEEVKTEKVENEESTDNNQKDTETTRPINEETDSNSEDLENLKMMLEEGVITQEEYDAIVGDTDSSTDLQDDLETPKKAYEMGDLTEEEYKDAVDLLNGVDKKDPIEGAIDEIFEEVGETTHVPGKLPPGATYADPSQDGDINYDDVELPEHLKGKWM